MCGDSRLNALDGKLLIDNPVLKRTIGKMNVKKGKRHPPKPEIYVIMSGPMTNESAPLAIVYPIIVARLLTV